MPDHGQHQPGTPDHTDRRLRQVIAAADLLPYDDEWSFFEAPLNRPPVLTTDVICGQNSDRGGIYDYWGCPAQVRGQMRPMSRG